MPLICVFNLSVSAQSPDIVTALWGPLVSQGWRHIVGVEEMLVRKCLFTDIQSAQLAHFPKTDVQRQLDGFW